MMHVANYIIKKDDYESDEGEWDQDFYPLSSLLAAIQASAVT